jgi:ABC-type branched-subunit amino acid transport system ATPase component
MGYQALISLGAVENPLTHERTTNLAGAMAVLEDLQMLREKTAGNLDAEETAHLDRVLTDLRQAFEKLSQAASEGA